MPSLDKLIASVAGGGCDGVLERLYGEGGLSAARARVTALAEDFGREFGGWGEVSLFSAPGRAEIGGNHTDHNHGRSLAGAVNLDIIGIARKSDKPVICLYSKGFEPNEVCLLEDGPPPERASNALIRGMCAGFERLGRPFGGFDAVTTSDVLSGSGLSSSAAFENLVGTALDHLYGAGGMAPEELAMAGQFAENVYMKKPSGLTDQMASAVGGFISIAFDDNGKPVVSQIEYDFSLSGHAICITGPVGSHADLTPEYAAIPAEMRAVAAALGGERLRDVDEDDFWRRLPELYSSLPHRALLRAAHFFADDARVLRQTDALGRGDFPGFLRLVNESGRSSFMYLQNIFTPDSQGLGVALMLSEKLLRGRGAFRVHGGGFAGTVQAFVPDDMISSYIAGMEAVFGGGTCRCLRIRADGALRVI